MKWLEELKGLNENTPGLPDHIHGLFNAGFGPHVVLSQEMFDRLIEIADRAEWGAGSVLSDIYCPICKEPVKHGHHNTCPYHDDWRKE